MKNTVMQNLLWMIVATGLFTASPAGAVGQKSVPKYIGNTCVVDETDPFEPHIRIDKGEYKGLCVNPTLRRSAQMLTLEQAQQFFPGTQETVVANFSHDDQFWIAEVPFSQVEQILLQVEYFPMAPGIKIAHTQFRIKFANGAKIRLKPQSLQQKNQTEQTLDGMIFSVENISPYGELFDAVKGLFGQYRTAYRFISLEQKYNWMIRQQRHLVEQYVFKFDKDQARAVLSEGLRRGTEHSIGLEYNTIFHSCVTELFDVVDKALGYAPRSQPFIPNAAPRDFYLRGFLESKKPTVPFNEDY
jgi:hypothetical protein